MIDQCIYEVYKRDKKVFIPEFGAIIYSEFNDGVNFNALLNFDDGKVVSEIQKQQFSSEEDARKALEVYITNVKKTLETGKSVFFGGVGYLFKDRDQNISIQKAKSSYLPKRSRKSLTDELNVTAEDSKPVAGGNAPAGDGKSTANCVDTEPEDSDSSGNIETDGSFESAETALDQQDYHWKEASHEDFALPDDENDTSGHFVWQDARTYPERSSLKIIISAVIPIVLLAAGGYYYFNYYAAEEQPRQDDQATIVETGSVNDTGVVMVSENASADNTGSVSIDELSGAADSGLQDDVASRGAANGHTIYSVILGSFKIERNADNYRQTLRSQGIEAMKFYGRNSFYFVGYEKIEGKSRAMKLLREIRQGNPSAWIINYEMLNP